MKSPSFKTIQISATILVTIFIISILVWEKLHGGVITHHILQRSDLPGISNWWGLVLLPLISWNCFNKIQKRCQVQEQVPVNKERIIKNSVLGFGGALIFGVVLAVAFSAGYNNFINYQVDCLLLLFFFVPIYRPEYLFGFVLGMTFTFGAILPTAFGLIVAIPSLIVYLYIRPFILSLFRSKEKKQ